MFDNDRNYLFTKNFMKVRVKKNVNEAVAKLCAYIVPTFGVLFSEFLYF